MGPMAAYAISETEIYDEEQFQRYRDLAEVSITQYGGRYLRQTALGRRLLFVEGVA